MEFKFCSAGAMFAYTSRPGFLRDSLNFPLNCIVIYLEKQIEAPAFNVTLRLRLSSHSATGNRTLPTARSFHFHSENVFALKNTFITQTEIAFSLLL